MLRADHERARRLAAARECVARGATNFQWSVLNWNKPSIDFYKSLGAAPLGEWTIYRVSDDALSKLAERA